MWNRLKEHFYLYAFALRHVPLIFFVRPKIKLLNHETCWVVLPLSRRSKNHLGSLYFGALAIGADLVVGLLTMRHVRLTAPKTSLVFKDFSCQFIKKAMGDTEFVCNEGDAIQKLVALAQATNSRQTQTFKGLAQTHKNGLTEVVMEFSLTLSVKPYA